MKVTPENAREQIAYHFNLLQDPEATYISPMMIGKSLAAIEAAWQLNPYLAAPGSDFSHEKLLAAYLDRLERNVQDRVQRMRTESEADDPLILELSDAWRATDMAGIRSNLETIARLTHPSGALPDETKATIEMRLALLTMRLG